MHRRILKGSIGQAVKAQRLRYLKAQRLWATVEREFGAKEVPPEILKELRANRLKVTPKEPDE